MTIFERNCAIGVVVLLALAVGCFHMDHRCRARTVTSAWCSPDQYGVW